MPVIRSQVIFQGATAIPEDRFINTWHFNDTSFDSLATDSITARLDEFYSGTTVAGPTLDSFLSQFVLRTVEVRHYNLDDPEPRVPVIDTFTLTAYPSTTGIRDFPEEVAVVLSLEGDPPITPRRRGRLYIGPLNSTSATDATASLPCRVGATLRAVLAEQATDMMAGPGPTWVVWSPTSGIAVPVAGGFIDDAFDTQRRRGPDASTRTVWPLP